MDSETRSDRAIGQRAQMSAPTSAGLEHLLIRFNNLLIENAEAEQRAHDPLARINGEPTGGNAQRPSDRPCPAGYEAQFAQLLDEFNEQIVARRNQLERLESFI